MNKTIKRNIIILLSLLLMFGFKYLPAFNGLSTSGMQVLGIFFATLLLWLTISIDWPSLLMIAALSFVPELKINSILASAYGSNTFVFLMYTFILTYSLTKTNYIKRIASFFIKSKFSQKGPWHFICLYFVSILFLGSFISPTVLFFVYLPILEEIYKLLDLKKGDKLAATLMMGTVVMCAISSGMTPIAHVFPLIAMGLYQTTYNLSITYGKFMLVGVPIGLLSAIGSILIFKLILRPDVSKLNNINVNEIIRVEEKANKKEKIILTVFIFVICLWVFPSIITTFIKNGFIFELFNKIDKLTTVFPPLIGIVILSIINIDNELLLSINEAMSKGVSWPSLIICASTLALGSAITNQDIGITTFLSTNIQSFMSNISTIIMVLIFVSWAAIQTNFSSNIVTSTLVTTAALAITSNMTNINIEGIIILIGSMSSYAFATPPAMPSVAIAGSSGWTNTSQMMKYGFMCMIVSIFVFTFIGYPLTLLF